jgi:outer membrane protein assembly factor BamB
MSNLTIKNILLINIALVISLLLTACNGFFEKDNIPAPKPLVEFKQEVTPQLLWSANTKAGNNEVYLKFTPAITNRYIFTVSAKGIVTAINKINGHQIWQVNTHIPITAGIGSGDGIVVIGSSHGEVIALQETDGKLRWRAAISGEMLTSPVVQQGIVIIKTANGHVLALSADNGKKRWLYKQMEPSLILRAASMPLVRDNHVIVGFANGSLAKLSLRDGQLVWLRTITIPTGAFAIQRMIDIDANPIVFQHYIYVATYQGKLASLDWTIGKTLWSHDISSYTGMVADHNTLYLSDTKSYIWAFNANTGFVNWRQTLLESRTITAPVLVSHYLIVGDAHGYLHWLDVSDGHIVAREFVGASIYTTPIVNNNVLYVQTSNGHILAYILRK